MTDLPFKLFFGIRQVPARNVFGPVCHGTPVSSTLPDLSFPSSYLSSRQARAVVAAERSSAVTPVGRWLNRRRRRRVKVHECRVDLSSQLSLTTSSGGTGAGQEPPESSEGWRFVRLRATTDVSDDEDKGWGVYEMRVDAVK